MTPRTKISKRRIILVSMTENPALSDLAKRGWVDLRTEHERVAYVSNATHMSLNFLNDTHVETTVDLSSWYSIDEMITLLQELKEQGFYEVDACSEYDYGGGHRVRLYASGKYEMTSAQRKEAKVLIADHDQKQKHSLEDDFFILSQEAAKQAKIEAALKTLQAEGYNLPSEEHSE